MADEGINSIVNPSSVSTSLKNPASNEIKSGSDDLTVPVSSNDFKYNTLVVYAEGSDGTFSLKSNGQDGRPLDLSEGAPSGSLVDTEKRPAWKIGDSILLARSSDSNKSICNIGGDNGLADFEDSKNNNYLNSIYVKNDNGELGVPLGKDDKAKKIVATGSEKRAKKYPNAFKAGGENVIGTSIHEINDRNLLALR